MSEAPNKRPEESGGPPSSGPGAGLTEDLVFDALRPIVDPEMMISIVELGLIYGVDVDPEEEKARVRMTLTSPMCPVGPQIMAAVKGSVEQLPVVKVCEVELVWSPPWDPRVHASEEAKARLGIWS
jgi:metal-sulfur cluster biosynthetic enzyme